MGITLKRITGVLVLLLLFCSCEGGNDGKTQGFNTVETFEFDGVDYTQLIYDLNDLDFSINLDQVLQSNPERTLSQIAGALGNARSAVLILQRHNASDLKQVNDAFNLLTTAIGQYENYPILDFEQYRFDRAFNLVRQLRADTAKVLGIEDTYTWVLLSDNFADGIGTTNFVSFPGEDKFGTMEWVTNFQIDIPKAQVSGREGYAWLVSQPFSLKGIEDPSFRFFSTLNTAAPTPKFSLQEVVEKVFRTYVILDMVPGENPETIDDSRKIQIHYSADEVPLAQNFHDAWLPFRSLEEFKGHEVSFAFLFDTRVDNIGKDQNYYSWSIYDFELRGRGILEDPVLFTTPKTTLFKSLPLKIYSSEWTKSTNDKSLYEIESGPFDSHSFLLTALYSLPGDLKKVNLVVSDSLKGADSGVARILVSKNYKGGVSPIVSDINWEVLAERSEAGIFEKNKFDLRPYQGEDVVFAFEFESPKDNDFSWSIDDIYLESQGGSLIEVDYFAPNTAASFLAFNPDLLNSKFKKEYEDKEQSPTWKFRTREIAISGFTPGEDPKLGHSRLILGGVDLSIYENLKLRLFHSFKYAKGPGAALVQGRIVCEENGERDCSINSWVNIDFLEEDFKEAPDRESPLELTSWVNLPEELLGEKVEFSLFYDGEGRNTPNWRIGAFELGGIKR